MSHFGRNDRNRPSFLFGISQSRSFIYLFIYFFSGRVKQPGRHLRSECHSWHFFYNLRYSIRRRKEFLHQHLSDDDVIIRVKKERNEQGDDDGDDEVQKGEWRRPWVCVYRDDEMVRNAAMRSERWVIRIMTATCPGLAAPLFHRTGSMIAAIW